MRRRREDFDIQAWRLSAQGNPEETLMKKVPALLAPCLASAVAAQPCPEKNVMYWQAFSPGGESDLSARHQQVVLKKKCPKIDTIIQYKPATSTAWTPS